MPRSEPTLVTVDMAAKALDVSVSTVWRMIRRGDLASVRKGGRRLVPSAALAARARVRQAEAVPPLRPDAPIFRLVGAGRGGGTVPGARDKHGVLDRK